MNRYDIRNIASGQVTHSYRASTPLPDQPEWGPAGTFAVEVTDISAQVAADAAAAVERLARRQRILALTADSLDAASTVAQVKAAVKAILKELIDEIKEHV